VLLLSASVVMAAYVTPAIPNGDFSLPVISPDGQVSGFNPGVIPDWTSDRVPGLDINGNPTTYGCADSGVGNNKHPLSASNNYAYLLGGISQWAGYPVTLDPTDPLGINTTTFKYDEPGIYDVTGHTIAAGDQFKLNFLADNDWTNFPPGTMRAEVFATLDGGLTKTVLASADLNVDLGTPWQTLSLDVPDASAGVGQQLGVYFRNIPTMPNPGPNNSWIRIDNVQFVPVPEPATLVMLVLGGLAMLVWRRSR